jgi:transcriptional regulator
MSTRTPYQNRIELLQGTLDMLILQTLLWGPQHGHGIGVAIGTQSDDALQIDHGSLYPALHRLEQQGWIAAEWKETPHGRSAKFYRLTREGRQQLERELDSWKRLSSAVGLLLKNA